MPCFFFHVVTGSDETRDEEGVQLPDLEAARREALAGIRSILKDELAAGTIDFDGKVWIADGDDQHLLDVPFATAFEIRNPKAT